MLALLRHCCKRQGSPLSSPRGKFGPSGLWSWSLSLWCYQVGAFVSGGCAAHWQALGNKAAAVRGEKKPCCTLYTSCADIGRHFAENIKSDIICFCATVFVHLRFWTLNDWLTGWKKSCKQGEGKEMVRSGSLSKAFKQQQTSQIYVGLIANFNCKYNCWQI